MTVVPQAGSAAGGAPAGHDRAAAGAGDLARRGPVVVLATAYSGAGRLRSLLEGCPDLACTSGTGVLPLCEQAAAVWRTADGRAEGGTPSRLAAATVRALADALITSVLARAGKRRWCEFCYAMPKAATAFAQLYPGTRFVCLHRSCSGFIRAALDASPWGLADPALAPFTTAYPSSTTAALAAYWIAHTRNLLEFEASHPHAVLRVRFEDLAGTQATQAVASFLSTSPGAEESPASGSHTPPGPAPPGATTAIPAGLIPAAVLAQASDLLRQLGYPTLPE
jgi:hypothetical protein